ARDEALEARAAAERRAAQLDHELAQLKAEHAFQLDEHARARAHFEEQLAQARALVSAAGARADDLQRRLAELESAARLQRDQDPKHQQRLEQDRARTAGALDDLREERERVLGLIESQQDPRRAPRERAPPPPSVAVGQGSGDARQESELARLRAERAELTKTLAEVRAATAAATTRAGGHEEALAEVRARNAELESALAAE